MNLVSPQLLTLLVVYCTQKLAYCWVFLTLLISLFASAVPIAANADLADQWTDSCIAGLKTNGGRGSNAAGAYCGCMSKAAGQFGGDLAGMLAVMQAPAETKTNVYKAQSDTNKGIISACVARIEEVFGLAEEKVQGAARDQTKGVWGDPKVIEAARKINLNAVQAQVFKASVTQYSDDLKAATAKIFRDKLDIKRKLKKKRRVLAKRRDEEVMAVLEAKQIEPYKAFVEIFNEAVRASFGRR